MDNRAFHKQNTQPDLISGHKAIALPEKIGPYKIESLLNKGGMSLLYLGLHPDTHQALAIKVLSPTYVNHKEATARFLREAQIIAISNHPNIVKLYGQGEWENGLYIAMELIRGISLRLFITQQSLSIRKCLEITLQVAYALLHLHTHGVIHRDLKPENILVTEDGEIKVIDFGIAQLHEDPSAAESPLFEKSLIGTPNYMSPEQKENYALATFSSDIYSLGVILYELITGKLSYGMLNLALLPPKLRQLLAKALAISPSERYADISSFIHEISQYLGSKELEKERPGGDQIKEIYETIQQAGQKLCAFQIPTWPQMDIGMAKMRSSQHLGFYYDFFRFPDNTFLLLMASSASSQVDGALYVAVLKGITLALIETRQNASTTAPFHPREFLSALQTLLLRGGLPDQLAISLLFLDIEQEQLTFLSIGMPPLIHLPKGSSQARLLYSPSPSLETVDNWNVGDLLFLHSLNPLPENGSIEEDLLEAVKTSSLLSPSRQAETLLKVCPSIPSTYCKAVIAIERLG